MKPEYRGWNYTDRIMYDGVAIDGKGIPLLSYSLKESYVRFSDIPVEDILILMQWTGKLDPDGKKIFDGDILEYFSIRKIVVWNNDLAAWGLKRSLEGKITEQLATVDLNKSRVVGNIHEDVT